MQLQIWLIGGNERFKPLAPHYIKDAHAIIYVYAANNKTSLKDIESWNKIVDEYKNREKIVKFLVGNKNDIDKESRQVQY